MRVDKFIWYRFLKTNTMCPPTEISPASSKATPPTAQDHSFITNAQRTNNKPYSGLDIYLSPLGWRKTSRNSWHHMRTHQLLVVYNTENVVSSSDRTKYIYETAKATVLHKQYYTNSITNSIIHFINCTAFILLKHM